MNSNINLVFPDHPLQCKGSFSRNQMQALNAENRSVFPSIQTHKDNKLWLLQKSVHIQPKSPGWWDISKSLNVWEQGLPYLARALPPRQQHFMAPCSSHSHGSTSEEGAGPTRVKTKLARLQRELGAEKLKILSKRIKISGKNHALGSEAELQSKTNSTAGMLFQVRRILSLWEQ